MSLQIWLPLNGNLKNRGCGEVQVTSGTVQYLNTGKLGKCADLASRVVFSSTALANMTNENFSVAFWVRTDTSSSLTGNWVDILGIQDLNTNKSGTGTFRFEACYGSNLRACSWHDNGNYNTINGSIVCVPDSEKGKWHHVCVTMSNGSSVTYRDGVSIGTTTTVVGGYFNGVFYIGETNAIAGGINDLRIYNHALSVAEVKELAKGLVCHYKLDNPHESSLTNKYSGAKAAGQCSGNFTRTPLESERGYNYKLTRTGTGSSSWPNMNIGSTYTFTAGKRYYYSCKVRCHKWTSGSLSMRAARSNNDWVTNAVQVCSPSLADGKWHEYYTSQVVNETYTRSGSTVTCAPILEFYSSDQKAEGTVFDMDFDVKDLQVVESDVYVPFIQNEFTSTSVADCSGNGYNGTRSGTLTTSTDTARYSLSTNFNQSGYITKTALDLTTTAFSVNLWVKPKSASSQHFLFGTFLTWPNNGIGIYRDSGSNTYQCVLRSAGESTYSSKSITTTLNTWNMITVTYSGTVYTGYLNGVKSFEVTYGSNGNVVHSEITVGNSKFNGTPASENEEAFISDVRLYATALTADDVRKLYTRAASIFKGGALLGYEFNEVT